jgi:hypothetical protein
MSDVERICEQNHQRVRWAEEYSDMKQPMLQFPNRKEREQARKLVKRMRTASLACAAACGGGTAFVGIGIAEMNMAAIITGGIVVLVFLISGFLCEIRADEVEGYV